MNAIFTRRSVRTFDGEPVAERDLELVLRAGMTAPSAGNQQPWQFVVIRERETLDAIPAIHPHSKMLHEAPLAVLVCGDPALEKHSGYWIQDCSACVQNMLLEAAALGLGGCWLGVYPREERISGLRALLGIPAGVVPFALVALGHSAVEQKEVDRFRTERVHYGRW